MRKLPVAFLIIAFGIQTLPGCAGTQNPNFFPRVRPLFAGLDESKVPADAKPLLANAKTDFQLARRGKAPCHAKYVTTIPYTHSRVFEGKGYCITLVKKNLVDSFYEGPQIVLNSCITGGKPFTYDEVEVTGD